MHRLQSKSKTLKTGSNVLNILDCVYFLHGSVLTFWSRVGAVEPRKGPSTAVLGRLKSIKNIRDLSEACGNIAPGKGGEHCTTFAQ